MSGQDRIERQELDDGAPDDTVFMRTHSFNGGVRKTYHSTPECYHMNIPDDEVKTLTREKAQRKWKQPCMTCVVDDENR